MVWSSASEVHYMFLTATKQIYWSSAPKMNHQKSRTVWVILAIREFLLMLRDLSGQEELCLRKSQDIASFPSLASIPQSSSAGFQVFVPWPAKPLDFPTKLLSQAQLHCLSCLTFQQFIRFNPGYSFFFITNNPYSNNLRTLSVAPEKNKSTVAP